ncbi:raffinose/stachyose/melibiose transport system substrate-binding protein [Caldalkalibacillus uzonensis]|uniref:Raffinose/stachyose/melibiose transport system substrate-binding protein n=1 Tax=Caldalkalibacillus uzonensis TaxID=353224 RepID=A0ABU0CUB3_9BACI|nr:extracellular solute-binding protein [Caldalkalibacillus uzonensis]MDQ0340018.1 raffinose/stachyose/melibiose transport system substrate-binding protein [Caldalkalibacillus uzonensis]
MPRQVRIFWVWALVFAFLLVGCSGETDSGSGEDQNGQEQETTAGETVKLTITSWRTEDTEAYNRIIEEFNKEYPHIEVEFRPQKNTEYNTLLNTALQSGSAADIIQLRPYQAGMQLADAGYLEPLDSIIALQDFPPEILEAATASDGKIYGVPLSINSAQIYYNTRLFDEYGLEEPKTWDELLDVAETLQQKGIIPFAIGSMEGWILSLTHAVLGPAFYAGNDFVEDILSGDKDFTSEEFVASIEAMKELAKYFPDNYVGLSGDDMRTLFVTEQAGMYVMGSFELEVITQLNPDLEFDFFPTPPASGGEATITTWVDGSYGVNADSPHKQEALTFIEFMTSEQFGTLFANELKRISAVPNVQTDDPMVQKMADLAAENSTPYMILVYFNEGNPTTKQELEAALQGMYLDELTPEEVADKVQQSVNTWFEPNKE